MKEETIIEILQVRQKELLELIQRKKRSVRALPKGRLRANRQRNAWRYYWVSEQGDRYGKYLPKKERRMACWLAQKYYNTKVIEYAKGELAIITELQNYLETRTVEKAFENCPTSYQPLIRPLSEDEQDFLRRWKGQKYQGTPFREGETPLYAKDGTRMHSKAEVMIADIIIDYQIPYLYEKPVYINWDEKECKKKKVHPDFTLYDVNRRREVYWEHLGMMDDEGYVKTNMKKLYYYLQSGYRLGDNFFITLETRDVHFTEPQAAWCLHAFLRVW